MKLQSFVLAASLVHGLAFVASAQTASPADDILSAKVDEVVRARDEVDVHDLRALPDVVDERADLASGIGLQADGDHRLKRIRGFD